jgi:hypothetical protein
MDRSMRTLPEEMTARELVEYCLRTLAANTKVGSIGISELRWLYSFVIAARRAGLRWAATDVQKRLVEQGVDERRAEELGQIYGHCRAALHLAGKGDPRDEVWSRFLS